MTRNKDDDEKPVYMISVAAKLTGLHPQTLRIYERRKLLNPGRTPKSTRLYSQKDIEKLKDIQKLTSDSGVNLAGVKMIIELQNQLEIVESTLLNMEKQIGETKKRLSEETSRFAAKHGRRELVLVPKGYLMKIK